jgi:hypothetical protein
VRKLILKQKLLLALKRLFYREFGPTAAINQLKCGNPDSVSPLFWLWVWSFTKGKWMYPLKNSSQSIGIGSSKRIVRWFGVE